MKKLIRQWKTEIATTWDKFSFKGRIFLFAVLSFITALCYLNIIGKSLKADLEKIKKKAPKEAVIKPEDDQAIRDDLETAERRGVNLKTWRKRLASTKKNAGVTNKELIRIVLADIQSSVGDCVLEFCRKKVDKVVETPKKRRGKKEEILPKNENAFVAWENYDLKVTGSFSDISKFLISLGDLKGFFTVEKLHLGRNLPSEGEFIQHPIALELTIKISYLK